ncbi:MAG TPA: DUF4139 domain-containing protein [Candidatus Obscuribacterales bacterium]
MAIAQLSSRIDSVKIYSAGATVARVADLPLTSAELPEKVEIPGLPLALDDSSVRVRVEVDRGTSPIAGDVRIGLAVPPPPEILPPLLDEEVRLAKAEVRQLKDVIALIENEIRVLNQLQVPDRPDAELGIAPPPSPMSARLALANFSDEQIRARIQEKRETQEKLRQAQEHLDDLLQKQAHASTARVVRPNELRKTAVVSLSYEGTPPIEQVSRLVVEYFVPGARWTPTYVCRLNSVESSASIAVRALICQRTGEDWSGVHLELSTAEPMAWCALPELASLRLGRSQPVPRKTGWRRPPIGAEILFEDFDTHKQVAIASLPQHDAITNIFSPKVPPLPNLVPTQLKGRGVSTPQPSMATEYEVFTTELSVGKYADDDFCELEALRATPDETSRSPLARRARTVPLAARGGEDIILPQRQRRQANQTATPEEYSTDLFAYGLMRMGAANDLAKRGKLSIEQRHEVYLEILKRQEVIVNFDVMHVVQQAVANAQSCRQLRLPSGGINVRKLAGSFDYAYSADGRVDVSSDGQFHSVALTSNSTQVDLRYIVVPREDTNVFRIAQLHNPLQAPLLSGSADVYVDGEYILSTNIATVPPKGQMELGLSVEQAIKVARNTSYEEVRSGNTMVAFNELRHKINIDITNHLTREVKIEVRERLPIPQEGAKVDVQIDRVTPDWEKYEQEERQKPIQCGYRWRLQVPAKDKTSLSVQYTIKTFVDSELIDGNRREE